MWVAESQYEVLGTRFGVRFDDADVGKRVDALLGPFQQPTLQPVRSKNLFAMATNRPGDDRHHAFRDCSRIGRSESWTEVLDALLAEINRRAIGNMEYFGVHAGVVATGNRAIALPAPSGAGKSTLVAASVKAGFEYVSDEALCLDYASGSVIPYPKAFNLSRWSIEKLGLILPDNDPGSGRTKNPVSPDHLGGHIAGRPLELSAVVFSERRPGKPSLATIPPSEVMAGLLKYSFNHYRRPGDAFALTAKLAGLSRGWKLEYEDPGEAADLMLSELG